MISDRHIFQTFLGLPAVVKDPMEIVKAQGVFMYDKDGKDYLDLVSGVSVSNVGHCHPKVVEAVKNQVDNYMHLMVYGEIVQTPQVRLSKLLVDNLPETLDSVYFVNSGSEAIEGALKLAKRATGKTTLVHFNNAYHGGTAGALSMMGREYYRSAFRPLLPCTKELRFNDIEQLEEIKEDTFAVVMEPIQSEAGVIIPEKGFLEALRRRCDEVGALLIFDEIQMGMGRTGSIFAFRKLGVTPDILCLAKALGGGMPLGAFIASRKLMNLLTFNPVLGHITTFGGHPVCCAAGLAALQVIIDEDLVAKAEEKGLRFQQAVENHKIVRSIRRAGLFLGIDIDEDIDTGKLLSQFRANGLLGDLFLFREHAFRIAPPLTITDDETDIAITRVLKTLDAMTK